MIAGIRVVVAVLFVCAITGCQGTRSYELSGNAPVAQRATVEIPTMLDALMLDGADAPRHYASGAKSYRFVLAPADHELTLRYSGNSDDADPARREIVRSPPRTLTFTTAPGRAYRIGYRVPKVFAAQGETLRELDVWIETIDGAAVATPATPVPSTPTATNTATNTAPALDSLKQQWEAATPEERDAFWKWQGSR